MTAICLLVLIYNFAKGGNVKYFANDLVGLFHHDTLNSEQKQKLADQTILLQKQHVMIIENTAFLYNNAQHLQIPKQPLMPEFSDDHSIADVLLKAQLITDRHNFSMQLNNAELIIDGVKQSEETHQLILKKFMKKPGGKVNMNLIYSDHIL